MVLWMSVINVFILVVLERKLTPWVSALRISLVRVSLSLKPVKTVESFSCGSPQT